MKTLKLICIIVIISSIFLLVGCVNSAKDEQEIIKWLNHTYGESTYTITKDTDVKDRWIIVLNEYPDIPFHSNVFHDWLALGSPIVQSDFCEIFCENAIKNS